MPKTGSSWNIGPLGRYRIACEQPCALSASGLNTLWIICQIELLDDFKSTGDAETHVSLIEPLPPTGISTTSSVSGVGAIDACHWRLESDLEEGLCKTRHAVLTDNKEPSGLLRGFNALWDRNLRYIAHFYEFPSEITWNTPQFVNQGPSKTYYQRSFRLSSWKRPKI